MVTTKTLRRQPVFALAGRLTRSARPPPASAQGLALGKPVQSRPPLDCEPCHLLPDGGSQPADLTHQLTERSQTRARPTSERLLLRPAPHRGLHTTTADRPLTPTVQNLPDNRASMPLVSHSSTATAQFGGFGLRVLLRSSWDMK